MHLSMLSRGEGGGGGDFDKAFMPEGVAFECLARPRVRIFDFSLSRGRAI